MAPLFRRHSNLQCFFCRSNVPYPQDTRNFKCPACGCWNRYDDSGEIMSDEPAMHIEDLNYKSFSKRASPSKNDLPSLYTARPLCHTCQTNQTLLVNLLSNYLPAPESPDYEQRLAMLPAYKESLHSRYPPVCETCAPLVEEEIRRKEQMARVKALGGWLSKGRDRHRRVSSTRSELESERNLVISETVFWWKIRGVLWILSFALSILNNLAALRGYYSGQRWSFLGPVVPPLVLASLLWTAWDPTYASFRKSQIQGRDVRQHGKQLYNILTWFLRLICSILLTTHWLRPEFNLFATLEPSSRSTVYLIFYLRLSICVEFMAISSALFVPRLLHPPAIRLVDTGSHKTSLSRGVTPAPNSSSARSPTPAVIPEHDILSTLSLSSKPIITTPTTVTNPMFGLPSLQASVSSMSGLNPRSSSLPPRFMDITPPDEDEMDWTPTNPSPGRARNNAGRSFAPTTGPMGMGRSSSATAPSTDTDWLRPQRFFAPEKPTGLEGLLENTRLQDDSSPSQYPQGPTGNALRFLDQLQRHVRRWSTLYALGVGFFIPVIVGVLVYQYFKRKIPIQ